ncbi:MAG: exodeoxyribonuclease VII large subunit [Peptococcaceae bacterium BICA1-7]|nr:MAG: exodeoxyribonuclease VII large subunit [Peptococcaceae bacterium BICA1-7]HBV96845.1 exodeoxyribonuclease VII large subunit [Desulfotomaculum sp.]
MFSSRRIITVSELTSYIKGVFERDALLASLWVKGEISNLKQAGSGHIYFTLKDSNSCVKSVMFRSRATRLLFSPENGMSVRVRGYVSVYERDGSYQLYAEEMEPEGVGALHVAFEQLKEKLRLEGLFEQSKKKRLPALPGCIAIVTSPTGAAIRDMIEIIGRRWPGALIILAPVTVQGDTAPGQIAAAIRMINAHGRAEVIIAGRGGGSLEELWAFNTEEVARAIYNSRIPVISAVGHETDFTIADLAADLRAPTPSAAAELVVPVKSDIEYTLATLGHRMIRALGKELQGAGRRLENCTQSRIFRRPVDAICGPRAMACDNSIKELQNSAGRFIAVSKNKFSHLAGRLNTLSPLGTLARGYSVCIKADSGHIVRDAGEIAPGDRVNIELHRGSIKCEVKDVAVNDS